MSPTGGVHFPTGCGRSPLRHSPWLCWWTPTPGSAPSRPLRWAATGRNRRPPPAKPCGPPSLRPAYSYPPPSRNTPRASPRPPGRAPEGPRAGSTTSRFPQRGDGTSSDS
eukprot:5319413-Alexandrium_andersonii.AAC.1